MTQRELILRARREAGDPERLTLDELVFAISGRRPTQKERVINVLRRNPAGACLLDFERAQTGLGYTARNRIAQLRKENVPIHSERCTVHPHRSAVARYRILSPGEQLAMSLR